MLKLSDIYFQPIFNHFITYVNKGKCLFLSEKIPSHRGCSYHGSGWALFTILHGIKKFGHNEKAPGWGYQGQKGSSVDDRNYHAMDRAKIKWLAYNKYHNVTCQGVFKKIWRRCVFIKRIARAPACE